MRITLDEVKQNMLDFQNDEWSSDAWGGLTAHVHARDVLEVAILKDEIDEYLLIGYNEPN